MRQSYDTSFHLKSPDDYFRRRLMVVYGFAFSLQIIGSFLQRSQHSNIEDVTLLGPVLVCAACLGGMVSAYFRWQMRIVGRLMMLFGGAAVFLNVVLQGGLLSYNASSIFVVPAICALMLGSRDVLFFGPMIILGVVVLFVYADAFPPFSISPEEALAATFRSSIIVVLMIIASLYFTVREAEKSDKQLRALLDQQHHAATHDALTGLANRSAISTTLSELSKKDARARVYIVDLDGFKSVNDTFGHQEGDAVLRDVTKILKDTVPETATVARLGGDEFFIVEPLKPNEHYSDDLGDKLVSAVRLQRSSADRTVDVTASVGSVDFPTDAQQPSEILSKADRALYSAKHNGKARFVRFCDLEADLVA